MKALTPLHPNDRAHVVGVYVAQVCTIFVGFGTMILLATWEWDNQSELVVAVSSVELFQFLPLLTGLAVYLTYRKSRPVAAYHAFQAL
jgi:hypothetical protein